ncbi:aminotransferase class V-fold PLP-dependent enzyme [Salinicoccus hispanicus]|uniref:Aminotransferase class V-fold PLP-dependent enzyme n=1 Tax=Salinicoccus hispanicus TaxID=157225 RepID=A0A6N8U0X9_9STAP|nr:aminotransferase class V-fold PLP-dependent enzyme [Salinicoccus hispanicus]MXQ50987.1 aminotransferase class V-fold PLP-dependent enzyme [Salinicoccus hispanicus]
MTKRNTEFFPQELQDKITEKFFYLKEDAEGKERIFFENAGGTLRLRSAIEEQAKLSAIPDSPERSHSIAKDIQNKIIKGKEDVNLLINAKSGKIAASLTASELMFEMIATVAGQSNPGNIVTTAIEHPSSYDACQFSANKFGHEVRVAEADKTTGSIPLENMIDLIDENTRIVSLISTSNITGAIHDMKKYTNSIRMKNPNTYIIVDAVQGAPHKMIDIQEWEVDGLNIAPYKMFGNRGVGFAWLSDGLASLPHHRLLATSPDEWDLGSKTPAHYAVFSKVIDYICMIGEFYNSSPDRRELIVEGMTRIHSQEQAILERLLNGSDAVEGINDIDNVEVHFENRNGLNQDLILALTFDNISNSKAVECYEQRSITVFAREDSSLYSKRILEAVGLKSIVRVSPIHCHSADDVDKFLIATREIAQM